MTRPEQTPAAQLVADARAQIEEFTVEQLAGELARDEIVVIDVREQAEREVHGEVTGRRARKP